MSCIHNYFSHAVVLSGLLFHHALRAFCLMRFRRMSYEWGFECKSSDHLRSSVQAVLLKKGIELIHLIVIIIVGQFPNFLDTSAYLITILLRLRILLHCASHYIFAENRCISDVFRHLRGRYTSTLSEWIVLPLVSIIFPSDESFLELAVDEGTIVSPWNLPLRTLLPPDKALITQLFKTPQLLVLNYG